MRYDLLINIVDNAGLILAATSDTSDFNANTNTIPVVLLIVIY